MIAYKFLRAGGIGPFTEFRWPLPAGGRPGPWVSDGASPPSVCARGVHACAATDLPVWLGDELWVVELAGEVQRARTKLVAERGRLVERVDAWTAARAEEFARACADRAQAFDAEHGADAAELAAAGSVAAVAYVAAHAAAHASGSPTAMADERAWQARWLERRLGL